MDGSDRFGKNGHKKPPTDKKNGLLTMPVLNRNIFDSQRMRDEVRRVLLNFIHDLTLYHDACL